MMSSVPETGPQSAADGVCPPVERGLGLHHHRLVLPSLCHGRHLHTLGVFVGVPDEEVHPGVGVDVDGHAEGVATVGQDADDLDGEPLAGLQVGPGLPHQSDHLPQLAHTGD